MKKVISLTVLFVLSVSALSVSATTNTQEVAEAKLKNTLNSVPVAAPTGTETEGMVRGKSSVGVHKMRLAINLRMARLYVAATIADPTYLEEAADLLEELSANLSGTKERKMLLDLARSDEATIYDIYETLGEIAISLHERLDGEALWAFKTGYSLFEVFAVAEIGNIDSVRPHLWEIGALAVEGRDYASPAELVYLHQIARMAENSEFSEADFDFFLANLDGFIAAYLPIA